MAVLSRFLRFGAAALVTVWVFARKVPSRLARVWAVSWMVPAMLVGTGPLACLDAITITETADATLFGHLDQAATSCPLMGCGATAAVNSFVYLQNRYPATFTTPLVPTAGATMTQADMVAVANDLAQRMGIGAEGTSIERFILGKMEYLVICPTRTLAAREPDDGFHDSRRGRRPAPGPASRTLAAAAAARRSSQVL